MSIYGFKYKKRLDNNVVLIVNKIKPFLLNGTIILSSEYNSIFAFVSPTCIKHCSFVQIEGENINIIELNEKGFQKKNLEEFVRYKDNLFIFYYHNREQMDKSIDLIYKYKNRPYGFIKDDHEYCYSLLFKIYNFNENEKKVLYKFNVFWREYINANCVFLSTKFIPICALCSNRFILFNN